MHCNVWLLYMHKLTSTTDTDMTVTFTKTQNAQPMGQYKPTAVDAAKACADFRILQVGPNYIRWADGRGEMVSNRKLAKLQADHSWACDF